MSLKQAMFIVLFLLPIQSIFANTDGPSPWSITPFLGITQLSDFDASVGNVDGLSGSAAVDLDSGINAGLSVGYQLNQRFAMELGWEYRTNDSAVTIAAQSKFDEGNYASNSLFFNGYYYLTKNSTWQPYIGLGVVWLQEIDIDLERNGEEFSYSGSGDVGLQVLTGVTYKFNEKWSLQTQLRYGALSNIDLAGEEGAVGEFADFDYQPLTLQFGMAYRF